MNPIYLDYNATTPIDAAVAQAMMPYLQQRFGNPSSTHWYGVETMMAVMDARAQVASMLHCSADEIIFTSGGTEANNLALKGLAFARKQQGGHIITSSVEHPAISEVCNFLQEQGFRITRLPVNRLGMLDAQHVADAIDTDTMLVSVMLANNETGTIQPLREIAQVAHQHNVLVHTDASQAVGKIPVSVAELGVDMLTLAGHKIYAHKGVGALYLRQGITLQKQMHGAGHERGLRAGTENVLEIVGLGKACELIDLHIASEMPVMAARRDALQQALLQTYPDAVINGDEQQRLPNTLSISFPGRRANEILRNMPDVAASAGAACHSDSITISPVLKAMGIPEEIAMGTLRLTVGRFTSDDDIQKAVPLIVQAINAVAKE
jgi:cysteine desulfurase NifS